MSINGSLRETSLADVLQLLSMGRKTGCLSLTHRGTFASVFFAEGRVTYASIVNRRERIGERLVQAGVITAEQFSAALDTQRKRPQSRLGDVLLGNGVVSRHALQQQIPAPGGEAGYLLV